MPPGGGGAGGANLSTVAAISLSGTYIFNALDGNNRDAVEYEVATLDVCASHPTPFGQYHYHIWSPCLRKNQGLWSGNTATLGCTSTA